MNILDFNLAQNAIASRFQFQVKCCLSLTCILLASSDEAGAVTVGAVEGPGATLRPFAETAAPEARISAFLYGLDP